jgi:hypothetical protein
MFAQVTRGQRAVRLSGSHSLDRLKRSIACVLVLLSCQSFVTEAGSSYAGTQAVVKMLHLSPPKAGESRYFYVPFAVPSGATQINISYEYDRANGSNALDIGLFDPRFKGPDGKLTGFRGWSGGRRSKFFVAREAATPGYIPGQIPQGTWQIILSLYQIVAQGVDVTIRINFETHESEETKEATSAPPFQRVAGLSRPPGIPNDDRKTTGATASKNPRWFSGDLHLHTLNSDGDWTVSQMVQASRDAGLAFIVITDHNTYSHHAEIDRLRSNRADLLIMRGEEITTYGGHANAWGLPANALLDFRVSPGDQEAMSRIAAEAHRRGALISINHPFALCPGCNWSYSRSAVGFDAIEVWNGAWDNQDEQALELWDKLLQQGRRITAVASSDSHRQANPVGQAATHVAIDGDLTEEAVLKSIRAGRAYLTRAANGPTISFSAHRLADRRAYLIGDVLRLRKSQPLRFQLAVQGFSGPATVSLISQGQLVGTLPADPGAAQFVEVSVTRDAYFRVEVRDQNGTMLAITNPIYVEIQPSASRTQTSVRSASQR